MREPEAVAPWWVGFTYLIYVVALESLILGGTAYAVFVLDQSGWWFLLAVMMSSGVYQPYKWHDLFLPDRLRIEAERKQRAAKQNG